MLSKLIESSIITYIIANLSPTKKLIELSKTGNQSRF